MTNHDRLARVCRRIGSRLARVPAYPTLIAVAFVLTLYVESAAPIEVLVRPLLVAVLVTIGVQLVATVPWRRRDPGALFGALALLVLVNHALAWLLFLAATGPLVVGLARTHRVPALAWPRLTSFLNMVSAIAVALIVATAVLEGAFVSVARSRASVDAVPASASAPDIYLLMLDGYPRADTLAEDFAFDNGPFLDAMREEGFVVADKAHSNYNLTALTLASMFNMQHVGELLPDPPTAPDAQLRALGRLINGGAALRKLRELGYSITTVTAGVPSLAVHSADRYIDPGHLTSFEASLLRAEWLPQVLPDAQRSWFHDQQRHRIRATFDKIKEIAAEDSSRPRFVFAHVMTPHPPIVFEADGSPRDGWGCFPEACGLWDQLYGVEIREPVLGQVTYTNTLVLDTARRIVEANSRPAVVVVFSDHGFRHDLDDRDEMLRSLFLSYTPGRTRVFPDDASPINIVPRILNTYAGAEIPLATEEAFVADLRAVVSSGYLGLRRWKLH